MSYDSICKAVKGHGEGVLEFSQNTLINRVNQNTDGLCRGFCTKWLASKKSGRGMMEEVVQPKLTTSLLHTDRVSSESSNLQTSYLVSSDGDSDLSPSSATCQALQLAGLGTTTALNAQTYQSFANTAGVLSSKIMTSGCNYFILSIKGTAGGHSVAFYRPWQFFGKSSTVYFVDPNFGEFRLTGEEGVDLCLGAVEAAYQNKLSCGYRLWGFN